MTDSFWTTACHFDKLKCVFLSHPNLFVEEFVSFSVEGVKFLFRIAHLLVIPLACLVIFVAFLEATK